jgi:hypothetical protein
MPSRSNVITMLPAYVRQEVERRPRLSADSRGSLRNLNRSQHHLFPLPLHMSPGWSAEGTIEASLWPEASSVFYRKSPAATSEHTAATGTTPCQSLLFGSSRPFLFFAAERGSSNP